MLSRPLCNLIRQLQVRCKHHALTPHKRRRIAEEPVSRPIGCEWEGKLELLDAHLHLCVHEEVSCAYSDGKDSKCPVRLQRSMLAQHQVATTRLLLPFLMPATHLLLLPTHLLLLSLLHCCCYLLTCCCYLLTCCCCLPGGV